MRGYRKKDRRPGTRARTVIIDRQYTNHCDKSKKNRQRPTISSHAGRKTGKKARPPPPPPLPVQPAVTMHTL
jgi:hypothetical protein